MIARRLLPALLLVPLAAGCGGSGTGSTASSSSTTGAAPAPSAPATAPTASAPATTPTASTGSTPASSAPSSSAAPGAGSTPAAGPTSAVIAQGPDAVLAAARAGLVSAGSVRLVGTGGNKSFRLSMDMRATQQGGRGFLTLNGDRIDVVAIGDAIYFKTGEAFYRKQGAGEGAKLVAGRWVKAKSTTKEFSQFKSFTTLDGIAEDVLQPTGRVRLTEQTTKDGQQVVGLARNGGALYVTATDPVRPVLLVEAGGKNGLHFKDYGAKVSLNPPADALDPAKLGR